MSIFVRHCIAFIAAALLIAGCSPPQQSPQATPSDTKPEAPRLSMAEVIRIARATAERQGVHLQEYKEPEAHYEFVRKDKRWIVFFDARIARPGDHFSVSVDDQTGEARFHGGA